jgi:ABC-type molybdate transport system substrate-binding protein
MPSLRRHFGLLSHPWLLAGLSLSALFFLGVLLWSPWDRPAFAGGATLRFYCAAGMSRPVPEILRAYQEDYGGSVQVTYDGSARLLNTIRAVRGQGDLFLAADALQMARARKEGLVAEVLPVGIQRPVLVVSKRSQQELRRRGRPVTSVTDLLRDDLKVVLANPELASIGQLSREVLARPGMRVWPRLEKDIKSGSARVSFVGTVTEVAQNVRIMPGTVGIVWSVIAAQDPELEAVAAPEFAGVSEPLQVGVLTRSGNPTAALHLARYVTARDRGLTTLRKYGVEPVRDADLWADRPTLHLAAGAMLRPGLEDVLRAFEQREGVRIDTSYNGCGLLVAQMRGIKEGTKPGKFPDAFFACDVPFLDKVQTWFDAAVTVSKNDMVLVVPRGNPHGVKSLRDLTRKDLRVGLPHPTHSALGKLTDDLLTKLGLHAQVYAADRKHAVVHTEAAHALVNQMRAGALDLAVVFRSNALSAPADGERAVEPIDVNLPEALATQPFAIARDSPHKYLIRRLLEAIVSPASAQRFRSLGFHWAYEPK